MITALTDPKRFTGGGITARDLNKPAQELDALDPTQRLRDDDMLHLVQLTLETSIDDINKQAVRQAESHKYR